MKNISKNRMKSFLTKNYWEVAKSTNHFKISFKNEIIKDGVIIFKTAKLNIHLDRDPISESAVKEVKKSFENLLGKKYTKEEFTAMVNKCKRVIDLP